MSYGLRVRRGFVGMGVLDYNDLLAQANLQNCDPMDSSCVSNNVAKQAAVEDFWAAHQSTGVPDNTVLTFHPQTPAEVQEFYNPTNLVTGGNVVDTRGVMQVAGTPPATAPSYTPPPVPPKTPASPPAAGAGPTGAGPGAGAGSGAGSSGGAQGAPALTNKLSFTLPTVDGFDLSTIPLWAWAGAAALALFALGGRR